MRDVINDKSGCLKGITLLIISIWWLKPENLLNHLIIFWRDKNDIKLNKIESLLSKLIHISVEQWNQIKKKWKFVHLRKKDFIKQKSEEKKN